MAIGQADLGLLNFSVLKTTASEPLELVLIKAKKKVESVLPSATHIL